MPALEFVPPIDDTAYQSHQKQVQSYPQTSPHQIHPVKQESPNSSCNRQTSPYPSETATDMYRHPSPVGSYHSMSPFNYTAMASQQQTQFSPEFTAQFQHHPGMITSAATNLSPCAETSPVAAQQHTGSPSWPPVSSALPGYPSSPATGGSEWAYQTADSYPSNSSATVFPSITGSSTACTMPGSIPGFEDYTTGYPAQMFPGQQGMMSQMRCSYEWAKASSTYRVNPQTGKTRTKDKYRVVYTDHQRLELEKEFHYSRYITIRRKAELAVSLGLSERQVKIWFQNRRAKERKQSKKRLQSQQGSDNQDDLEEDEKHIEETSPSTSPAAITHELPQQRTSDGDFMLGNTCAQTVKSELVVNSFMVPQTDLSKNSELLNALRTQHHHHTVPPPMAS